jgi:hypothetical protein
MVTQKRMLLKVVVAQVVVKMVGVEQAEVVDLDMARGALINPLLEVSLLIIIPMQARLRNPFFHLDVQTFICFSFMVCVSFLLPG